MPMVGIVMGSDSDLKVMSSAAAMLEELGIDDAFDLKDAQGLELARYLIAKCSGGNDHQHAFGPLCHEPRQHRLCLACACRHDHDPRLRQAGRLVTDDGVKRCDLRSSQAAG